MNTKMIDLQVDIHDSGDASVGIQPGDTTVRAQIDTCILDSAIAEEFLQELTTVCQEFFGDVRPSTVSKVLSEGRFDDREPQSYGACIRGLQNAFSDAKAYAVNKDHDRARDQWMQVARFARLMAFREFRNFHARYGKEGNLP